MPNLRRYSIQVPNLLANPWGYRRDNKGAWVKFEDVEELLNIPTNNARDEILHLLDQADKRLAAGHVVHVGQLLDKIRAKLLPVT